MGRIGIKKSTVLVLGAGASIPFGFPSGETLTENIYEGPGDFGGHSLLGEYRISPSFPNDPEFRNNYQQIISEDSNFRKKYREFKQALELSGQASVDAFLEGRPDFVDIGKLAIAGVLLNCEDTKRMFGGMAGEKNWYKSLFNKLTEGRSLESFGQNRLAIVTFNYDRSLEQYLFTALKHSYGKTDEECAKAVETIPIIHVYGSLGSLPWQAKDNNTPYGLREKGSQTIKLEQIVKASETITIIRNDNDLEEFNKARELMDEADRVYFLGFGYDKTNVDRLKLSSLRYKHNKFGGTCMGLSRETIDRMRVLPSNGPPANHPLISHEMWQNAKVYDFLHDHIILN